MESVKTSYISQKSELGSEIVKIILWADVDKNKVSCSVGIGEDDWVIKNGKRLSFDEATAFFSGIAPVEDAWI
jgi:hypothetical protein